MATSEQGERAARLLEYLKGEVRDMRIDVRMQFVVDLFLYLKPEVEVLVRQGRIEGV